MRAITVLVVLASCSSKPTPPAETAAPPKDAAVHRADAVVAATPPPAPADDAPPAIALAKRDFAPAFAASNKHKDATALNAAGLALHAKRDLVGAEAKYLAALVDDPGHVLARYNLACVYVLAGKPDRGLALLDELATASKCPECRDAVDRARWDDDWQTLWDRPTFWDVVEREPPDDPRPPVNEPEPKLVCPPGAVRVGTWGSNEDYNELYCVKGGVKHGPYWKEIHGYDLGEGTLGDRGDYRNGRRYGLWRHAESYGDSPFGAYIDDVPHGLWVIVHKNGVTHVVYVHGKLEGYWKRTGDSMDEIGHYVAGQKQGVSRKWYGDSTSLAEEGAYDHDQQHGRWVSYDEQHRITSDGVYDHGKKQGLWVTNDDGEKRTVGTWDHDVPDGVFEYWFGGKRLAATTLDHGTGDWVRYEGKELVEKGRLDHGARDKHWEFLDGRRWLVGDYAAGNMVGTWTVYQSDDHAKLHARGPYVAGKRAGTWTYWTEDGTIQAKGAFAAGEPDGTWFVGGEDKESARQIAVFRRGKLVRVDGHVPTKGELYAVSDWADDPSEIQDRGTPPQDVR